MKNRVILSISCWFVAFFLPATPSIRIQNVNADVDIAEMIKEALDTKLTDLNSNCQIELTFVQDGDALTVDYIIHPEAKTGKETCENVWRDLETFIQRIVNSIKQMVPLPSSISYSSTSGNTYSTSAQEKIPQAPSYTAVPNTSTTSYTPSYSSFTLSDVAAGRAYVGGLIIFPDGTQGVIFYLDNQRRGLAVSLDMAKLKWEDVYKSRECHDILALPNEEGEKVCTYRLGENNCRSIINQLGIYKAPAVKWCLNHGTNWYLPSAGEIWYLLANANKSTAVQGPISQAIVSAGGTPLEQTWYWSSTENDDDEAINVSSWGRISSEDKIESLAVRAVRAF